MARSAVENGEILVKNNGQIKSAQNSPHFCGFIAVPQSDRLHNQW